MRREAATVCKYRKGEWSSCEPLTQVKRGVSNLSAGAPHPLNNLVILSPLLLGLSPDKCTWHKSKFSMSDEVQSVLQSPGKRKKTVLNISFFNVNVVGMIMFVLAS